MYNLASSVVCLLKKSKAGQYDRIYTSCDAFFYGAYAQASHRMSILVESVKVDRCSRSLHGSGSGCLGEKSVVADDSESIWVSMRSTHCILPANQKECTYDVAFQIWLMLIW